MEAIFKRLMSLLWVILNFSSNGSWPQFERRFPDGRTHSGL
ncbi:hypothetical protein CVCC1112_4084 [Paenarthrobacter nicotinovorans]|nr:hypothetical protein CVCC1112_4084 [Paenarthrobacter nicotinovorans]